MTIRVCDLEPGDLFVMEPMGGRGIFIMATPHPLYQHAPGMRLVVWWLIDERMYSFDALLDIQELPGRVASTPEERRKNFQNAIKGGQQ